MKSSAISSAKATPRSPGAPSRKEYALTGHSVELDPKTNAVRADLADIRLADRVFAPHYAAPLPIEIIAEAPLRGGIGDEAEVLGQVAPGETFEMLERSTRFAWGIAASGLVGYIATTALGEPIA